MALIDKMGDMDPITGRQVAGRIVAGLISAKGWQFQHAPDHMAMHLSTLNRLMKGTKVQPAQYRKAEVALDIPLFSLDHVVNGDVAAIRALDMEPAVKSYMLTALQAVNPAQQRRRRSTDG
jgi:hypothetical protein